MRLRSAKTRRDAVHPPAFARYHARASVVAETTAGIAPVRATARGNGTGAVHGRLTTRRPRAHGSTPRPYVWSVRGRPTAHRLHWRSSSAIARTSALPSLTSSARSRTCSGEVMTFRPDATR